MFYFNIESEGFMDFDYGELRKRIKEKLGLEIVFAKRLGMSKTSLSLRLNNQLHFSQRDIAVALRVLSIPEEEAGKYFLRAKKNDWEEFL
ncbi:hypothetical protein HMPREF3191_00853 [Veillonellaceae bacterium DNF00626]|nr:hypothetical protein HMPREF3191_00853 [Veillonellaceae bacterium DNF00626]